MDKACPFLFFKWGFGLFHPGASTALTPPLALSPFRLSFPTLLRHHVEFRLVKVHRKAEEDTRGEVAEGPEAQVCAGIGRVCRRLRLRNALQNRYVQSWSETHAGVATRANTTSRNCGGAGFRVASNRRNVMADA